MYTLDFSNQIYKIEIYKSYSYVNFSSEIHQTKIISKFNDYINIETDQLRVLVGKYTRSVTSELIHYNASAKIKFRNFNNHWNYMGII